MSNIVTNTVTTTLNSGAKVEKIETSLEPASALNEVFSQLDQKKGAILSSGFDYPGRHSRWDIGFYNPAIEIVSKQRTCSINALNEQGEALLDIFFAELSTNSSDLKQLTRTDKSIHCETKKSTDFFTEEQRSKQPSIFSVLRTIYRSLATDSVEFSHFGLYGAFGYDLIFQFEDIDLKLKRDDDNKDCHLFLPLELVIVDRKKELASKISFNIHTPKGETSKLCAGGATYSLPDGIGSTEILADHHDNEFSDKVKKIIEGTMRGDYFEVVLSQTFSVKAEHSPTSLFKKLAEINPSPYMFLMNFGDEQLVGASPELYARVTDRRYETCPIAGTVPRGKTAIEDAQQVKELLGSNKEESELTMCTDVDRNDMARVCVPGTVKVIGRRQLEFYSHLIHTVDHLEGTLAEGFDSLDAFQTHMWACTVTGAPKPAAVQEIENLEKTPRGWYSGAVGFLCFNGDLNTGITLRTAHLKNGRLSIRAGATLLYGSDPKNEEQETRTKAAAFLSALAAKSPKEKQVDELEIQPLGSLNPTTQVVLVDCRDSFVHNLAAYLRELGVRVTTVRAGVSIEQIINLKPDLVVLSPGPGTPSDFGLPNLVGEICDKHIPLFGVCLGHQAIGEHFGAKLCQLPLPEHGKAASITHTGSPILHGVKSPFEGGRYHSLYLDKKTIPDCLEVLAETTDHSLNERTLVVPMAIKHHTLPVVGLQFHPESLMTLKKSAGKQLLHNIVYLLTGNR